MLKTASFLTRSFVTRYVSLFSLFFTSHSIQPGLGCFCMFHSVSLSFSVTQLVHLPSGCFLCIDISGNMIGPITRPIQESPTVMEIL